MPDLRTKLPSGGQCAFLLALVGVGLAFGYALWSDGESNVLDFDPPSEPAEYLYLDAPRVLTYLPQALGGLPGDETQSLTRTRTLSLDLKGTAGPSAGGALQEQRTAARSLTVTAASRFFVLLDDLLDAEKLRRLDFADLAEIAPDLQEGEFVHITNIELRMPDYASDYDIHKTRKDVIAASGKRAYTPRQRRAINAFLAAAGTDPRVSFLVESAPTSEGPRPGVTLLIPAQYSLLAVEPTLLTGRQTVVGKVMRNLTAPDGSAAGFAFDRYTDTATIASFRPALRVLPQFAIDLHTRAAREALVETRRRLNLDAHDDTYQARLEEFRSSPLRTRERLQQALAQQTTVTAPGLVVLPLAIYK